jgi:hypothetical protein
MAPLTDPRILALFRTALALWNVTGYVTWSRLAREWVERNLEGHTVRGVGREMFEHLEAGGEIDQVKETREEYLEHEHHYDFRIRIGGRLVYLETRLDQEDPDEPVIHVVNAHDA